IGKITEPRPLMMRVPRKPYTTRASWGPALRYRRASMAIKNMMAKPIRPAKKKKTAILISIGPPLFFVGKHWRICQLFPRANVGDATFVARDHDLGSFADFESVFAASGSCPSHACLREDQLAGAGRANDAADGSKDADHVVVGGVQLFVLLNENFCQEK